LFNFLLFRYRHILYKFHGNKNRGSVKESEIYIEEMKVFNSQIKVVPSFHRRTLHKLQEVSRANRPDVLPKAFSGRRRRERERERMLGLCRYPFTKLIIFRVLSKHGFQFVTLAIAKISSRLLSDTQSCEVSKHRDGRYHHTPNLRV
jgi:hypothetical protein